VKQLLAISLKSDDGDADRVRRSHAEAIGELQGRPMAAANIVEGVSLADGVATSIPHGLGRPAKFVTPSAPRGPSTSGRIEEIRGTHDRNKYVVLKASGYGATITVDVLVA
jgi:hypothetical protein